MEKESLVIVDAAFNAANPTSYTLNTEFFDFTTDGVVFNGGLDYGSSASDYYVSNADYKYSTFPVNMAASIPSQDKVIFIDSLQENSKRDTTAISLITKGGYESLDVNENIIQVAQGTPGRPLHVYNGVLAGLQVMSAKGLNGDVIAEVVRNNENVAVLQFLLSGDLDPDNPSHKYFSVSRSYNTSIHCTLDETPKMMDGTMYFPISVTAGDFDYDGCDNELAVVWSDINAVHVKVFSLTYTAARMSARTMAVDTIYESSFTYNYPASSWQTRSIKSHGTNMDGFSTVYSCCIVKGDFDADGKE